MRAGHSQATTKDQRLLDTTPDNLRFVNTTRAPDASTAFAQAWELAAAVRAALPSRAAGSLSRGVVVELWGQTLATLPAAAQLIVPGGPTTCSGNRCI